MYGGYINPAIPGGIFYWIFMMYGVHFYWIFMMYGVHVESENENQN
jgi:hypothetical protein